jgi:hypothetical protein
MQIITLPTILPGELNLEELNKQLRQGTAQLDWSAVISAPESQLNILLNQLDLDKDADSLGVEEEIAENIASDIIRYFDNKNKKSKKSTSKSQSKQKNNKIALVRSEGFIPHPPSETEEDFATDEEIPPTPLIEGGLELETQLKPPSPYEIRAKLEQAVLADLLGPAGGENEEIDEASVRDRYLVGLLAPQRQQVSLEQQDELAVAGSGNTEEGTTESNTVSNETMFPSSFGMTFCVSNTATALQVTAGWGQYERTKSEITPFDNSQPKTVWKRHQILETSSPIPLTEGEISKWVVNQDFPDVIVLGRIKKQSNQDWIVSLFLINGQKELDKLRDRAWLFQPELSVVSADLQHTDIFLKRGHQRASSKLDPVIAAEEKAMAMLYRLQVEFAIGHGVSVSAETTAETTGKAVKLSTSVVPVYEVPKSTPPQADEIPELKGLVLDMQELSQTTDLITKLNPLITAYETWIQTQSKRISDPKEGLTDYQDTANTAINNCKLALKRIQSGLQLLETNEKAAEAFRFMNKAMYLQRLRSIYSEQVRQGKQPELDQIPNPTWYPFQLAFILLNLPSSTDLHHPDRSHETDAVADLLWFPTGGGKTEAYLGLTAYTIALRRLQSNIGGRNGESGVAVLMRYTLRLLTLQQFQRATTLICACESIRREQPQKWGKEPFRIGLWVGQRTTPNHTEQSEEFSKKARGQYQHSGSGSPHQLTNCPWCGTKIDPGKNIEVETVSKGRGRTLVYCGDNLGRCLFTKKQSKDEGLPILVVDEEIYRRLPTLLIATVDKFAQMPWKGEVQMLFGKVNGYCSYRTTQKHRRIHPSHQSRRS